MSNIERRISNQPLINDTAWLIAAVLARAGQGCPAGGRDQREGLCPGRCL